MIEASITSRSHPYDATLHPHYDNNPQPGSCSSSSHGSASSWDHTENSSAPTSDSESSRKWRGAMAPLESSHRPHEDAPEATIWNAPSISVPQQSTSYRPQQPPQSQHPYHFSPPHSTGSGSPPDRSAYAPESVNGPGGSSYGRPPPQSLPQPGPNGLSPHVEPFNPTQMSKQAYPPPASYARLINPRTDFVAQLAEKRSAASLQHEPSYESVAYGSEAPSHEAYGAPAHSSGAATRELQPTLSQTGTTEEISTIFVVGFPEDLQEREFQNMFIFSPGFEAATLKTPAPGSTRDREASQAGRPPTMLNGFPYGGSSGPNSGSGGAGLDDMGEDGGPPSASARKQIIGFAKFRSRAEAIDARNVLSGRKVDAEKGSVLKAEMAKKNLHTKRGLANDAVSGVGNPAGNASLQSLPALLAGMLQSQPHAVTSLLRQGEAEQARLSSQQSAAFDAFHSVPGPSPNAYAYPSSNASPAIGGPPPRMPPQQQMAGPPQAAPPHHAQPAPGPVRPDYGGMRAEYGHRPDVLRGRSPPRADSTDVLSTPPFAKSLMQQLDADDEHDVVLPPMQTMHSAPTGYGPGHHFAPADNGMRRTAAYSDLPPASTGGHQQSQYAQYGAPPPSNGPHEEANGSVPLRERMGGLSLNTQAAGGPGPVSTSLPSPGAMSPGFPRTQNPADQNPPINTLYVGGLPAVLPSLAGPLSAAHLEECLRSAFSRCAGFRRLCFRQKTNGPMCFVEFEDVHFASRALSDMYGHTLNGLVKSGIRLSFSKNPLGVAQRTGSMSNGSGPLSPTSMSAFLPPPDGPYPLGMSTSPTPTMSSGGPGRRPSDASYASMGSSSAPRSLTPRSAVSPPLHGTSNASAFSPFGYSAYSHASISESY